MFAGSSFAVRNPTFTCKFLSVFQDVCYQFLPEEEAGYDEANSKCGETGYHLVDNLNAQNTEYLTSRLERERESKGTGSMMAWVGALREAGKWEWASGGRVENIDWGRGQPNNYNQVVYFFAFRPWPPPTGWMQKHLLCLMELVYQLNVLLSRNKTAPFWTASSTGSGTTSHASE